MGAAILITWFGFINRLLGSLMPFVYVRSKINAILSARKIYFLDKRAIKLLSRS